MTLFRRVAIVLAVLLCIVSGRAHAQNLATIPSITSPDSAVSVPQPQEQPEAVRPQDTPAPVDGGGSYDPPTVDVTTLDSGLTKWVDGLFSANGWVDTTKAWGLAIAACFMSLMVILPIMKGMAEGNPPELTHVLGSGIGVFVRAFPTLILIARYEQWANVGVSVACNSALGLASQAGDTAQSAGSALLMNGTQPAVVCAGQLNPLTMLQMAAKYAIAFFSMQIPIPHQTNGVWEWVLGPIASMGDNMLATLIAFTAVAVACATIVYAAIELVMIAIEALFGSTLMPLFLPFKLFPMTADLGEGGERYLKSLAVRIFFLLLPIGIGFTMLNVELGLVQQGNVSLVDLLVMLASCVFYIIVILRMKKLAKVVLGGESSMSTVDDVIKPALTAALEVGSLMLAGYGAMSLLGMGGGGAALAGAGAGEGAGAGFMDLGMATPMAGPSTVDAPTASPSSMLPPPRNDIVPSESMPMQPPLSLPGETTRPSSTRGSDDFDARPSASPEPPRTPPQAPSDPLFEDGSLFDDVHEEETSTYGDLTPPSFTRTESDGAVTWELNNADELRRQAAARRAAKRADAGSTTSNASPSPEGPRVTSEAPPPPRREPERQSGASEASSIPHTDNTSTNEGPPPIVDAIDAHFTEIDDTHAPPSAPHVAPPEPPRPQTVGPRVLDMAQRFLELRAMTSPKRSGQAYFAARALDALRTHMQPAAEEETE